MMGRCIGIPTRYVEGFIVDYEKAGGYDTTYLVRGKKAHAWVEAYFEGFGWVAFEPSSGYEPTLYYPYENEKEVMTTSQISEENESSPPVSMPSITPELQEAGNQTLATNEHYIEVGVLFIGRVLFLFILFILAIQCVFRWQYHRTFKKADVSNRFRMRFYEMLYLLEKEGIKLRDEETLSDYERRIKKLRGSEGMDVGKMIVAYVKLKYSEKPLSHKEGETLEKAYQGFMASEQTTIGSVKLFKRKFVYHLSRRKKI